MQKLLVICGPTATGKTALALKLARRFSGELIAADSRQVYRGMDIGTGKDIPKKFKVQNSKLKISGKHIPYYGNGTKIWGYDLVEPNQEFSVSQFVRIATKIVKDISSRKKLPILVGGTGLYIDSLIKNPTTIFIPQNQKLRRELEKKNVSQLQQIVKRVNRKHFNQLNYSDQNNPRRLIRAIEIASYVRRHQLPKTINQSYDPLWIGLKAPPKILDASIEARVAKRATKAMDQEVKKLTNRYRNWLKLPAFSATGYKIWRSYLEKKMTKTQALKLWSTAEKQYARRQLTWFKKNPSIHWFDVTQKGYRDKVEAKVKNWYRKES